MSGLRDDLLPIYSRFRETGLPCFIGGSIAAMAYGEPRATLDIDVVASAAPSDAELIRGAFDEQRYRVPPKEVLVRELTRERDGSFQILDRQTGMKGDFYLVGSDELLRHGLDSAREIELESERIRVAHPNYTIAIKLRYYSLSSQEKHLNDIQGILRVSSEEVDRSWVAERAIRERAKEAWEHRLREVGEG